MNIVTQSKWQITPHKPDRKRAGLIPTLFIKGIKFYIFAIDARTGDLIDFGGHFEAETDQDLIDTCIRECYEESYGVFGEIKRGDLEKSIVLHTDRNFEFLWPVGVVEGGGEGNNFDIDFQKYLDLFHTYPPSDETDTFVLISRWQLLTIIDQQEKEEGGDIKIYDPVLESIVNNRSLI